MATSNTPFSTFSSGFATFAPIGGGGFGSIYKTPKTLIAGSNVTLVETPTTTTISATGGGGGGVNKFVDLTDVQVGPIPLSGAVTLYNSTLSKWVQSPAITHNAADDKIALTTTGAIAINGNGNVGVQSLAGELALAGAGDSSLTSAVGNVNITSLVNTVAITSGVATTIDAVGGIALTSGLQTDITSGTTMTLLAPQTITLETTGVGSNVLLSSEVVETGNGTSTATVRATGVSTVYGMLSTEIGLSDTVAVTNIRGNEVNVVMGALGVAFVPSIDTQSIVEIVVDNKSAAQYALDIASTPSAVPNVQFVLDNVSAGDIRIGGQAPSSTLTFGTTNTQEINVIKGGVSVLSTTSFPNKTVVNGNGGSIDVVADGSIKLDALNGNLIIQADAGIALNCVNDQITITTGYLQINDATSTQRFGFLPTGELKTTTPNYETLVTTNDVMVNKKYVDDRIGVSASTFEYSIDTLSIAPPITAGDITYNNATQTSSTLLYFSHQTRHAIDVETLLGLYPIGTSILIQDKVNSSNFQKFTTTAIPLVTLTQYVQFAVSFVSSGGTGTTGFANNLQALTFFITGGGAAPASTESPGWMVSHSYTANTIASTGNSYSYYMNAVCPSTFTATKMQLAIVSPSSDSIRCAVFTGHDLTAVLKCQSATIGSLTAGIFNFPLVAEVGQNLVFTKGATYVVAFAVSGVGTTFYQATGASDSSLFWINTTDLAAGFATNPQAKTSSTVRPWAMIV